ncbi:MAG TPA: hypothetical protein VJ385_12340 [Fibrobacteria bacterium]|nr:hypothetical protein [Fibrobacteria bacterium]
MKISQDLKRSLAVQLRDRSRELRKWANVSLWSIWIGLFLGFILFLFGPPFVLRLEERISRVAFSESNRLIAVNLLRVSSGLLLAFMIQILVSLFRYNIRLSHYYESRADALELMEDGDESAFEKLVSVLSSEKFEFDKLNGPADQMMELAKTAISNAKKG